MPLYREQGVVLRTYKLGEADRIVSLVTRGRGKVRAVAKGARKPGSRFSRLEASAHVGLQLYEGRNLDTVTQVETLDAFGALRQDLDAFGAAMTLLEATDQVAQEEEVNPALYRMLVGALKTLSERRSQLVLGAYLWKLLSLEGFHPQLDGCIGCGSEASLVMLNPERGGVTCVACAPRPSTDETVRALELVRMILGGHLDAALSEADGPATEEVERLAFRAVEFHFDRRLRSGGLLAAR